LRSMDSRMAFAKTLGIGIARFYACVVFFNLAMWLPGYFQMRLVLPIKYQMEFFLVDVFLDGRYFRGIDGLPTSSPRLLEFLLGPLLLTMASVIALQKSRFQIAARYLILLFSFWMSSLVIGLLIRDYPFILRTGALIALLILIPAFTFGAFYHLFTKANCSWNSKLTQFAATFLFPSASITLMTVIYPFVRRGWDSTVLEIWFWIYWPVMVIASIAALFPMVKMRLRF
jgi:hypothetical protein